MWLVMVSWHRFVVFLGRRKEVVGGRGEGEGEGEQAYGVDGAVLERTC